VPQLNTSVSPSAHNCKVPITGWLLWSPDSEFGILEFGIAHQLVHTHCPCHLLIDDIDKTPTQVMVQLLHRVQSKLCVTTTRQRISCILCSTAQYHIHTLNPNTLNPKPFRQSTWLVSPQALHESQQSSEQQIHHHYKVHLCTWKRCFQGLPYKTRSLVAYENTIHSSSCDLV
jgi:hypothetical protein